MYICIYIYIYTQYVYVKMNIVIFTCIYIYIHIHMYICKQIYIYIYPVLHIIFYQGVLSILQKSAMQTSSFDFSSDLKFRGPNATIHCCGSFKEFHDPALCNFWRICGNADG